MVRKIGHVLALLALVVVQLLTLVSTFLCLVLCFGLGMVFLFPPQVRMIRWVTGMARYLVRASSGIVIEPPYLPKPPPPQRQPDGLYRSHRTLYKTPRMPRPGTTAGSGCSPTRRPGATGSGCCSIRASRWCCCRC
ncbi:hypothetical protein ACFSTC_57810 [Nonomuraea ferruginea]